MTAGLARAAVFLDRDGVLDEDVAAPEGRRPPWKLDELVVLPGAVEACRLLREAGFVLVVVTNQPDIGRGLARADEVARINAALVDRLGLDDVRVCPHDGRSACSCRKPAPGLLLEAAEAHDLDLAHSWLVGDRWVDIAAGAAVGVTTVLVARPGSWRPTSAGAPPPDLRADHEVEDVLAAATLIVAAGAQRSR